MIFFLREIICLMMELCTVEVFLKEQTDGCVLQLSHNEVQTLNQLFIHRRYHFTLR